MPKDTAVVWFRRDLRVRDHPALAAACRDHDRVVPLFVLDRAILTGRFRSAGRTDWMLGCLRDLDASLRARGGRLVVRDGADVVAEVRRVAREVGATTVHVTGDVTPYGRRRDGRAEDALAADGVALVRHPGLTVVDVDTLLTKSGRPYTVYSPFRRAWRQADRRPVERAPSEIRMARIAAGAIPEVTALGFDAAPELADRPEPGEAAARRAAERWLKGGLGAYAESRNTLAVPTSRMGAYLRFGCVSPRWLEERCVGAGGDAARAYLDEIAWRDFYASVLRHFPDHATREFVAKYRGLQWPGGREERDAWREGRTGYPVVDAAMRQLRATGFMHNRARMIVGSFLTKDLGVDWRVGEEHFMAHLLDGDQPANNGGWQWIASTGTDPAPYFQRLFNPMTQQERFDPDGAYVRRWCPELANVPDEHLARPWEMTREQQEAAGCVIGRDWPEPIVDHAEARRAAIARYRAAGEGTTRRRPARH